MTRSPAFALAGYAFALAASALLSPGCGRSELDGLDLDEDHPTIDAGFVERRDASPDTGAMTFAPRDAGLAAPCLPGCAGCCDDGVCVGGTQERACGTGGAVCMTCDPERTCVSGACL